MRPGSKSFFEKDVNYSNKRKTLLARAAPACAGRHTYVRLPTYSAGAVLKGDQLDAGRT